MSTARLRASSGSRAPELRTRAERLRESLPCSASRLSYGYSRPAGEVIATAALYPAQTPNEPRYAALILGDGRFVVTETEGGRVRYSRPYVLRR